MCTVSFLPTGPKSYILSSNRDESPKRAHTPIVKEETKHGKILFPKDSKGGSWLFCSDFNWTICILNGAFRKHQHEPPYIMSRGLMAKSIFQYDCFVDFLSEFKFQGIEPFTCIMVNDQSLLEFRWDGREKHIAILDKQKPYVWSSSTLYNDDWQKQRKNWFDQWLKSNAEYSVENIHHLHRSGGIGDPEHDYVMSRQNKVCTTSISHVVKTPNQTLMIHYDLMNQEKEDAVLENQIKNNSFSSQALSEDA